MPRFHAGFSFGTMAGPVSVPWPRSRASLSSGTWCSPSRSASSPSCGACGPSFRGRGDGPDGRSGVGHVGRSARGRSGRGPGHRRPPEPGARGALAAWREPRTLLIGLVVLAAALTEGAANDWVGLAVVDGFGTSDAMGAVALGIFLTAMTGMRLLGTGLLDRYGRVAVLRLSAGLAFVGLLVFTLVPNLWVALVGVVLWGAGAALGFPVGMSAASDDPAHAAVRVSVVSTIGYSAFFVGPPLIGFLAEYIGGYRPALLVIAVPLVIGLLVVNAARPLPTAAGSAGWHRPEVSAVPAVPAN
ncbi:MFS transporter [Oerskovia sp. M15]